MVKHFMWGAFTTTKVDPKWVGILIPPPLREKKVMTGMYGCPDLLAVLIPMVKTWKLWGMDTATATNKS